MAQDNPVSNALRLQKFSCRTRILKDCSYQECLGTISGFSQPVLFLLPQKIDDYRIHFHGHKLKVFPEYDQDLVGMADAFEIPLSVCRKNTAIIIPGSRGACSDYDHELVSHQNFQDLMEGIHQATDHFFKHLPLHLSAHSGGGRVLGRMLSSFVPVDRVSVFDGIYTEKTKEEIRRWYQKTRKPLLMATVHSGTPFQYSTKLFEEMAGIKPSSILNIRNTNYVQLAQGQLNFLTREAGDVGKLRAHYDLVNQTWDL